MYIHGGAFYREITAQHWKFVAQAVRATGLDAIVPIYPLLPRPGSTAAEVIEGFMDLCDKLEQPIISIIGGSAGGMYTLATMQQLIKKDLELAKTVRCIILISPVLDVVFTHPEVVRRGQNDPWLGIQGLRQVLPLLGPRLSSHDPIVSPLFGDIEALPPVMLLSGTYGMLLADAQRSSAKFQDKGTEICMPGNFRNEKLTLIEQPEMVHVYPLLLHPEGAEARQAIVHFLKQHIAWFLMKAGAWLAPSLSPYLNVYHAKLHKRTLRCRDISRRLREIVIHHQHQHESLRIHSVKPTLTPIAAGVQQSETT